ncbi:amino acid ABC transporter permease [Fundicoccus ignavus]|uniref:ABC transporter permease subunit n=1 Tax=Fundicoccus ignavus TaxID=2664442 RepID=A0A844BV46_9LACT|nr:amino acid ABC transporter permease [Fundicoccus ignavus]MRJ45979.1 ABC transporter permease subunit [Fundicoccus ignavus]
MGDLFNVEFMLSIIPEILSALPKTIWLASISGLIGLIIGLIVALIRYFEIKLLTPLVKVYVSFIRGTPAILQLFIVYYGIPILLKIINQEFGTAYAVNVPKDVYAIIALSLNAGAFMSETFRSSLLAVDIGQLEACYSINLTTSQALRRVIIPQAFVIAIPPLSNTLVSLVKETSLLFMISIVDLMAQGRIVAARSYRYLEMYIVVSLIYWVVCSILAAFFNAVERRYSQYERRLTD